jgi:hypothetical protein
MTSVYDLIKLWEDDKLGDDRKRWSFSGVQFFHASVIYPITGYLWIRFRGDTVKLREI